MLKGNQLKFQRGAAAKTEGEDRNNGGENCHHAVTVRLARENLQCFSALWRFEQGQRQNRRREADALRAFADAVAHSRAAHGDRADTGHDLAFRQMPMAHQPRPALVGQLVGMASEQGGDLGLDGLRQQRSRAVAQHLRQRVSS